MAKSNLDKSLEYEAKLSSLFSIAESQRWKIKSERGRESMTEREKERGHVEVEEGIVRE